MIPQPTITVRINETRATQAPTIHESGGIIAASIGRILKKSENPMKIHIIPITRNIHARIVFSCSAAWNISPAVLVPLSIRVISDHDFAMYEPREFADCLPRILIGILLFATVKVTRKSPISGIEISFHT